MLLFTLFYRLALLFSFCYFRFIFVRDNNNVSSTLYGSALLALFFCFLRNILHSLILLGYVRDFKVFMLGTFL